MPLDTHATESHDETEATHNEPIIGPKQRKPGGITPLIKRPLDEDWTYD